MSYQVIVRVAAVVTAASTILGAQAFAQSANPYSAPDAGGGYGNQAQPTSPYSPPPSQGPGQQAGGNQAFGNQSYGNQGYSNPGYGTAGGNAADYGGQQGGYSASPSYAPQSGGGYRAPMNDAYVPPSTANGYGGGGSAYSPPPPGVTYSDPGMPVTGGSYGTPYTPAAPSDDQAYRGPGPANEPSTFNQEEIINSGHSFFGSVSKNLASAVEYVFQSQGRPNGYILGEDAGGAFVLGLRYGEGRLYTKDAGDYKVFWQGPSLGYDAGAEGSKAMVLVYNLRDPGEIYNRYGGVQGAAYMIGGISVQFQKYNDVTLAIIRSGVGLRLGANIGYLNYTRSPTWNPL